LGIKLKRILNKILQENWGFRCPEYHTIKFQIIRNINNQTTKLLMNQKKYYKPVKEMKNFYDIQKKKKKKKKT